MAAWVKLIHDPRTMRAALGNIGHLMDYWIEPQWYD